MHTSTRKQGRTHRDAGTGGFIVWIAVYAAFMVALIAFNGTTQSLGLNNTHWRASAGSP